MKINSGNFLNYFTPIVTGKYLKTLLFWYYRGPFFNAHPIQLEGKRQGHEVVKISDYSNVKSSF